jgi:hypothetical protein
MNCKVHDNDHIFKTSILQKVYRLITLISITHNQRQRSLPSRMKLFKTEPLSLDIIRILIGMITIFSIHGFTNLKRFQEFPET